MERNRALLAQMLPLPIAEAALIMANPAPREIEMMRLVEDAQTVAQMLANSGPDRRALLRLLDQSQAELARLRSRERGWR